jgi:hypothetical protein
MLKRAKTALAIVAFLALFGFLAFQSGVATNNNPRKQSTESSATNEHKSENPFKRLWEWTTHDPVAFYTSLLVLFTAILGGSTVALWWSTRRLVRGAEETAQRQLRAYVGVTVPDSQLRHPDPSLQSSDPSIFKMVLEIKNSGQTPAYDTITRYTTMLLDHPVAADYDFFRPIGVNPSTVVLNPNACIRSESTPHPLSASEVEEMKDPNSKRRLYTFGEITYRDAFNTGRHTHFCFYNEWDGETFIGHVSEHYNDAD